jgi:hypothetical protein
LIKHSIIITRLEYILKEMTDTEMKEDVVAAAGEDPQQ